MGQELLIAIKSAFGILPGIPLDFYTYRDGDVERATNVATDLLEAFSEAADKGHLHMTYHRAPEDVTQLTAGMPPESGPQPIMLPRNPSMFPQSTMPGMPPQTFGQVPPWVDRPQSDGVFVITTSDRTLTADLAKIINNYRHFDAVVVQEEHLLIFDPTLAAWTFQVLYQHSDARVDDDLSEISDNELLVVFDTTSNCVRLARRVSETPQYGQYIYVQPLHSFDDTYMDGAFFDPHAGWFPRNHPPKALDTPFPVTAFQIMLWSKVKQGSFSFFNRSIGYNSTDEELERGNREEKY